MLAFIGKYRFMAGKLTRAKAARQPFVAWMAPPPRRSMAGTAACTALMTDLAFRFITAIKGLRCDELTRGSNVTSFPGGVARWDARIFPLRAVRVAAET